MSLTSSTVSGAVGTSPAGRGGAPAARRHTGAGATRRSGDAFSTLLDDLSQPERTYGRPERASAPAPVSRPRLAASRRTADVRLQERPTRPSETSSPVRPFETAQPIFAEALPEPLEVATGSGAEASAKQTEQARPDVVGGVSSGPLESDGMVSTERWAAGLDGPGPSTLASGVVSHRADASSPAAGLPEDEERDVPRAGEYEAPLVPPRRVDEDATKSATNPPEAHIDTPPGSEAPGDERRGAAGLPEGDHGAPAVSVRREQHPPAVSVGPEQHPPGVPVLEQGLVVQGAVGTAPGRIGVQPDASTVTVTPGVADAVPVPAREQEQSDAGSDSRDGGAGRDDAQAGGERLAESVAGQASAFAVRSDGDGATLEPPATEGPDASEHALDHQLVQAMRVQWRGGLGEATITLRPEYLGQVRISLRLDGGALLAHLQVEDPKVRAWAQSHEHLLKNGLAEQGLDLARLVVSDEPSDRGRREEAPEERGRGRSRSQRPWPTTDGDDTPRFEVRV